MARRRRLFLVALLALACVAGVEWTEGFAPHTDDGCATEIHCLACRTACVRPTLAAADPTPSLSPVPVGLVVPEAATAGDDVLPSSRTSRGPPLSS